MNGFSANWSGSKPRRGCLFIDPAQFSRPFFLFFGGANLELEN